MEHIQIAQIDLLLTDSIIELESLWRTFHHDNILFGYEFFICLVVSVQHFLNIKVQDTAGDST